MKPSEVLRTYGWIQREAGRKEIGFCIVGAIRKSIRGFGYGIEELAEQYYNRRVKVESKIGCSAIDWNDMPGRTADEVISVLESVGL